MLMKGRKIDLLLIKKIVDSKGTCPPHIKINCKRMKRWTERNDVLGSCNTATTFMPEGNYFC